MIPSRATDQYVAISRSQVPIANLSARYSPGIFCDARIFVT